MFGCSSTVVNYNLWVG